MQDSALYTYVATALVAVVLYRWRFVNLPHIPTVGPSLPVISYLGALRFMSDNKAMLLEGYQKFKGGVFKVAMLDRWVVIITGPKLVDDVRKLPDDQVSFNAALSDFLQVHRSFGRDVTSEGLHVDIVRQQLTRSLAAAFDDIYDEIAVAFQDLIPPSNNGWTPVPALATMQKVVARVSSRLFVGLPLCRNEEYLQLSINHTIALGKAREVLILFPDVLKPFVDYFLDGGRRGNRDAAKFLKPIIQERIDCMKKYGDDWSDKPDDMVQWLTDRVVGHGKGVEDVVKYMMLVNFGAIHTSSNSYTHALLHLAANPEYLKPLREEVDAVIGEEGWSKASMQKLKKVDSFIREAMRVNGIDGLTLMRMAMKDLTLSDGTFIPAKTIIVAPAAPTHQDLENYSDPLTFDPWRFSDMRSEEGEGNKHQFVTTSTEYLVFGHGKHACPGRFFAANELKAMFAHTVMHYDVKLENEGRRPENFRFANIILPDPTAQVLFRKRQD